MVPVKRVHDAVQNISRQDVSYDKGVMVINLKWSKTNQFGEREDPIPLIANNYSTICPVRWLLHMMERIPAAPYHNLFCIPDGKGGTVPITYRDIMVQMRKWLEELGEDPSKFSSHSLRRGNVTRASKKT